MKNKILLSIALLLLHMVNGVKAQTFYPEGTKWTELHLNTQKYDSWFGSINGKYFPNYELVDYYVKGDTIVNNDSCRYVWQHKEGQPDSIAYIVCERNNVVAVTKPYDAGNHVDGRPDFQYPADLYDFDWQLGKELRFEDMEESATTCFPGHSYSFGTIRKIEKGNFGTDKVLEYLDIDEFITYTTDIHAGVQKSIKELDGGIKLIRGIGVVSWNASSCIMAPPCPIGREENGSPLYGSYRSILVHFERDGEVLYDLWPNEKGELVTCIQKSEETKSASEYIYDLQGRKHRNAPKDGIYIIGGKKTAVKR